MVGVQRGDDGSWAWIAPCGASGGEHATSRDLTRESYAGHRTACKACGVSGGSPAPKAADAEVRVPVAEEKKPVVKKAAKRAGTVTGRARLSKPNTKEVERPANARVATPAEKAQFTKLVKAGDTLEHAWAAVRKAFPRAEWGKVRDVTLACSPYRTFSKAFADLHGARAQ